LLTHVAKLAVPSAYPIPPPCQVQTTSSTKRTSHRNTTPHKVPSPEALAHVVHSRTRHWASDEPKPSFQSGTSPRQERPLRSQPESTTQVADLLITSFMTASIGQLPNEFHILGSALFRSQSNVQFANELRIQNFQGLGRPVPRAQREVHFFPIPAVGGIHENLRALL
jgi:hypothetical protein